MFKNMDIKTDASGNLRLAPLLEDIKNLGFDMKNHVVSYFSDQDEVFVFVGKDPVPANSTIQLFELNPNTPLRIRLRSSEPTSKSQDKRQSKLA